MAKLSRDLITPLGGQDTLHPRENIHNSGTLAAVNAEVILPVDGVSHLSLDIRGTYVGTITLEGTVDGTNWTAIPVRQLNAASVAFVNVLTSAATGVFIAKATGFRLVRARMVAYTSGAPVVTILGHTGLFEDLFSGLTTSQIVTVVGASGAALTLTLPAPAAGLRHYLTYLSINRFAAAALTAAATPVTVTSTNLPGSLALSFAADAALQGSLDRWREDFSYPLAASAQATATTIVAPATTGVIWRLTAGFYVAP